MTSRVWAGTRAGLMAVHPGLLQTPLSAIYQTTTCVMPRCFPVKVGWEDSNQGVVGNACELNISLKHSSELHGS